MRRLVTQHYAHLKRVARILNRKLAGFHVISKSPTVIPNKSLSNPTAPIISSNFSVDRGECLTCFLEIPVGTCSPDNVLVVGNDGYIFVYEGSNNIVSQYSMTLNEAAFYSRRWIGIIESRKKNVTATGARFIQIIIPEKSSLLPHKVPYPASDATPLFRHIIDRFGGEDFFIDGRAPFNKDSVKKAYPKANSHMSPFGTFLLFEQILKRLGFSAPDVELGAEIICKSDLSDHFGGLQLFNSVSQAFADFEQSDTHLSLVRSSIPSEGHFGIYKHWTNPGAPVNKRVLAFGNSFFERGYASWQLSWWFSRWFKEFIFVWSPEFNYEIFFEHKPDFVICQTIERFLIHPPDA